ncbi:hypothetical protein KO361_03650 [Candidatus Woesearchaeota archaeon]|nr:hypothetical protein [Candidatus Woesearchaeota archaeon]
MYLDFRGMIQNLEAIGLLDVLLPFILIFTLVFAVLQKTKILGTDEHDKPRKNFNVILSLVMALGVVIPHITGRYIYGLDVVDVINRAIPNVALLVVGVVMVLLVTGVFGNPLNTSKSYLGGGFVALSILAVGLIFAIAAGWIGRGYIPRWLYFLYDPQFQALIVTLLVFALIINFITKEDKPKDDNSGLKGFAKEFNKMFGGN